MKTHQLLYQISQKNKTKKTKKQTNNNNNKKTFPKGRHIYVHLINLWTTLAPGQISLLQGVL